MTGFCPVANVGGRPLADIPKVRVELRKRWCGPRLRHMAVIYPPQLGIEREQLPFRVRMAPMCALSNTGHRSSYGENRNGDPR